MKKIGITLAIGAMSISMALPVGAQEVPPVRPSDSLSVSLNSLRHSASRMKLRNEWLETEIQVLEMKMQNGQAASVRPQAVGRYTSLRQKSAQGPGVVELHHKDARLDIAAQERRLLEEVAEVEQDIRKMSMALQELKVVGDDQLLSRTDQDRTKMTEANVRALRKQLAEVERRHAGSLEVFNRLQADNIEFKQKRAELDEVLQKDEQRLAQMTKDFEVLDSRLKAQIGERRESVAELTAQKKKLDMVLKKVDLRVHGNRDKLEITDQEVELLMENRHFIKTENDSLKGQFSRLQKDWKELKKSAKK